MEVQLDTIGILSRDTGKNKLTIYLPTHPSSNSPNLQEDRTRFKNSLKQLGSSKAVKDSGLADTFSSLHKLQEDVEFWQVQSRSLVIFADAAGYEAVRLPYEIEEIVLMADRFIVSPLEFMRSMAFPFYILDVNTQEPKLYFGGVGDLNEVKDVKLPGSMEDTLQLDEHQRQIQFHGGAQGSRAMYHGHGAEEDNKAKDTTVYLHILAGQVVQYLKGSDTPLLLAGDPKKVAQLRNMLPAEVTLDVSLNANIQGMKREDRQEKTKAIFNRFAREYQSKRIEQYREVEDTELAVVGATAVRQAAEEGRVKALYVPCLRSTSDSVRGGEFTHHRIEVAHDILTLDQVVSQVIDQAGDVVPIEKKVFEDSELRAICRY